MVENSQRLIFVQPIYDYLFDRRNILQVGGYAFAAISILLYLLAPDDPENSLPSPFASRFLWTTGIPISMGISVSLLMISGLLERASANHVTASILLIMIQILISPQFAEFSPIGADGWWFVEIGERYSKLGVTSTEGYTSRMLTVIPYQVFTSIFPEHGPAFASLLGILMSTYWIYLICSQVRNHEHFHRWGIPAFTFVFFLMVAWWSPLMYSAQLMGLILAYLIFHYRPTDFRKWIIFTALLCAISATHLQASIVVGIIMFVDGWSGSPESTNSRWAAFILGSFFIFWNFTVASHSFYNQVPDSITEVVTVRFYHLFAPLLLLTLLSEVNNRTRNSETMGKWGDGNGVRNLSIVVGCIIALPLMYMADVRIGASRMAPRLVGYCLVPLLIWGMTLIESTMKKAETRLEEASLLNSLIVLAVIAGALSAQAHTSYASRTYLLPDEMSGCWDDAEERGLVGLVIANHNRHVLHGPATMSPSTDYYFWKFTRLADEQNITQWHLDIGIIAVMESPDLGKSLDRFEINGFFDDWELVAETPGACRFWVHPDYVDDLDNSRSWERGYGTVDPTTSDALST